MQKGMSLTVTACFPFDEMKWQYNLHKRCIHLYRSNPRVIQLFDKLSTGLAKNIFQVYEANYGITISRSSWALAYIASTTFISSIASPMVLVMGRIPRIADTKCFSSASYDLR